MAGVGGLRHLLRKDWSTWRARDNVCMVCMQSFCTGSCNNHKNHHPQHATHIAMITDLDGSPVIRIDHIVGLGIDWNHIQRVGSGTHKSIPLIPIPAMARRKGSCSYCEGPCAHSATYCSLSCKLNREAGGSRRAEAEALVAVAFAYDERHRRDRFCTECLEAFCQDCCPEHDDHHEEPVEVIPIAHLPDGRPAVEQGDLPEDVTEGVQEILNGGGQRFFLIRPTPGGDDTGPEICKNRRCCNGIVGNAEFCSLWCKHVA